MAEAISHTVSEKRNRELHEWRLPNGLLHRTDGPARILKFRDQVEHEHWVQDGEYVRQDGGPTLVSYRTLRPKQEAKPEDGHHSDSWMRGRPENAEGEGSGRAGSQRHREGAPAVIAVRGDGSVASETWYVDGIRHRLDGPAVLDYGLDGTLLAEVWYTNGISGAADGDSPGLREYFDDGTPKRELWLSSGGLHRADGPAYSEWFQTGQVACTEWWHHGLMSRTDGPAAVEFHQGGSDQAVILAEQWRIDDRLHRADGPAFRRNHASGEIAEEQWWIDGHRRTVGGPAIERRSEDSTVTASITWSDDHQVHEQYGSSFLSTEDGFDYNDVNHREDGILSLVLRLWHRWCLGLSPAPDDAPFTSSGWLQAAKPEELASRLAYYPAGDEIADRVVAWRSRPKDDSLDPATVARSYVELIRSHTTFEGWIDLLDAALSRDVELHDSPVEAEDGEHEAWSLNEISEHLDVGQLLHESIYNASGNWFAPIYWITEPMHGVDVTSWLDFEQAKLSVVVGPNRFAVGPRY